MTVREILAKNLAYYRNRAELTQKAAAEQIGTKKTTLSSWEQGKSQPSADMLVTLCKIYKTSLSDLCGYDYTENFTSEEKELVWAFRRSDDLEKAMVMKILGIREKKILPFKRRRKA